MADEGAPDPEAWAATNALFHAALDQPEEEREAFVRREARNPALAADVLSLLDAHRRADGFIDAPAASVNPRTTPMPAHIGPYRIQRVLGEGGMGVVYLAEDPRLGRLVALKAVAPAFAGDRARRERLRREARAASAITHPGIAAVYALEEIDGDLYIAGEYVPGETLRAELDRGPLAPAAAARTMAAVARALAAAHARGIVHRDIKPENIVRTPDGTLKILDFGLARATAGPAGSIDLTAEGGVLGTPAYMSPEQIRGQTVDARSDLFAVGIMLYECLTGANPFAGSSPASTIARILEREPPPIPEPAAGSAPGVLHALGEVARICLRKAPDERYQSAVDLARALEDAFNGVHDAPGAYPAARPAAHGEAAHRRALWWWQFHQGAAVTVYTALVFAMWHARHLAPGPWGTRAFVAGLVGATIASAVRLNAWFTLGLDARSWDAQHRRSRIIRETADALFAAALAAEGALVLDVREAVGVLLIAAAAAVLVSTLVIEPATRQAASTDGY